MSSALKGSVGDAPPSKKKFGKNLNKLTKAPAPPIPNNSKTASSSRNGLLLLSTKRNASGGLANASSGGGILSSKTGTPSAAKPLPNLGLAYESTTSTHDALMGAVVGASRAESQQQLDAWGVSEKNQKEVSMPQEESRARRSSKEPSQVIPEKQESVKPETDSNVIQKEATPTANWEDYGGRGEQPNKPSGRALSVREERRRDEEARFEAQRKKASEKLKDLERKITSPQKRETETIPPATANARTLYDPNASKSGKPAPAEKAPVSNLAQDLLPKEAENVIHLKSYEDRSRGDRPVAGAPRMLFDPKSGSMVAVPTRDESSKSKKNAKKTAKGGREKNAGNAAEGSKNKKGRSDNTDKKTPTKSKAPGKDKRNARESPSSEAKGDALDASGGGQNRGGSKPMKGRRNGKNVRDKPAGKETETSRPTRNGTTKKNGKGRKNPQKPNSDQKRDEHPRAPRGTNRNSNDNAASQPAFGVDPSNLNAVTLETGFELPTEMPKMDWIKPNEKIELVTGAEDSPTLQATAREWAPNQSALARAVGLNVTESTSEDGSEDIGNEDDQFGLGFDPTLDMDAVIQSPEHKASSDGIAGVNLESLNLHPTSNKPHTTSHIFAFESGSTWGNHGSSGDDDWGIAFGGRAVNPDTFLSLPPASAWSSLQGDASGTGG